MVIYFFALISVNAQELYRIPDGRQSRVSSFENLNGVKGKGGMTNHSAKGNAFESLKAGESKSLLNLNSAGIIQRIWITMNDRSPQMLRSLRIRMYWDGSSKPAVDAPLGDFFGAPLGKPVAFQSALFSNPEGRSFNCYIPMPFKTGAKVVITNEAKTDLALVFFDIDYVTMPKQAKDVLYFHACWNRSIHGTLGTDMVLLPKVFGTGRFLGMNMGVKADSIYKNTWWGEGEVKMYLDGDSAYPTINGTGAEDYIGTGWGEGVYANLYQGCLISGGKENEDQYSFYRFHVPDEIFFYHNLKVTIQELGGTSDSVMDELLKRKLPLIPVFKNGGWTNFYRVDDYSATAYFYLNKPFSNLPALVGVEERIR